MTYDLGIDVERLGNVDDLLCLGLVDIYFHAVAHVEDFVHLLPVGTRLLLDELKQGRNGEEVVFYHVLVFYKVHDLGLSAPRAVHHAVHLVSHLVKHDLDDRCIGAGRREHELTHIHGHPVDDVGEQF